MLTVLIRLTTALVEAMRMKKAEDTEKEEQYYSLWWPHLLHPKSVSHSICNDQFPQNHKHAPMSENTLF